MRPAAFLSLFLLAGAVSAYVNLEGESGLYRIPSAEVIGEGRMAFTTVTGARGLDRKYSEDYREAWLADENLSLTYGFNAYLEGAALVRGHFDRAGATNEFNMGDSRLMLKLIYPPYPHREEFDVAFLVSLDLASGSEGGVFRRRIYYREEMHFSAGDQAVEVLIPLLLNFTKIGSGAPIKLHGFFGGLFTTTGETADLYRAGLGMEFLPSHRWSAFLEVAGETQAKPGLTPDRDPLFATLGFLVDFGLVDLKIGGEYLVSRQNASQVQVIKGQPLETGLVPRPGVFASVSFAGALVVQDGDHDGISDLKDKCPAAPEDRDNFDDADGCPDPDNDKDGTPDALDKCPERPEDADGIEDGDGCPDVDNDRDGVADSADKCPLLTEDADGFEDGDGCPELDNDKDGLSDAADRCAQAAEDMDGFEDADGCPDTDNDKDGIADADDRCINVPEIVNGVEDQDGCPDGKFNPRVGENHLLKSVHFMKDNRLEPGADEDLNELVLLLKYQKKVKIELRVHSDALGSTRQNKEKTQAQADQLRGLLIDRGADGARVFALGMGEEFPVTGNDNAKGRRLNNRVEVRRVE